LRITEMVAASVVSSNVGSVIVPLWLTTKVCIVEDGLGENETGVHS
jgi:hypothetical protein